MLTFEFKQDTEFSNPWYEIKYKGMITMFGEYIL